MPIKIHDSLPAQKILEDENIFVMTEFRAMHQDIRPLHVLILNLMPTKIETETQFLRKLSNSPLQVEVEFMQTESYKPRHVEESHLDTFYTVFDEVKDKKYDGL
ncbi:MAG TPA: homoserine O-succinyltransferase, partial [Lachnospiraceae bacterium]|nr:homoserine O-succinyltransferase [Lachnospiraceae bacterium]